MKYFSAKQATKKKKKKKALKEAYLHYSFNAFNKIHPIMILTTPLSKKASEE